MATQQRNIAHLLRFCNEGLDTHCRLARGRSFSAVGGGEGVSIPRTNPKRFFIPPLLYSTVVVSPAFLAVMWRLILPLSPYTQTHTHTHSQALEFRGVHSQYPMELYIFCNLISMPAPVPVLWMGEEEVQARNSLDLADFSQEKPVNAAPRGKMVIIAWR